METIQQSIQSVLEQINKAKSRGKHFVKIKTFQCEMKKNEYGIKVPSNVFVKIGMAEGGSGSKYLKEHGYCLEYSTTNRQATAVLNRDGSTKAVNIRDLKTTNVVISW